MEGERKPPASSVREAPAPQPQDTAVPMTDDDVEGLPDLSQETAPDSMVEDYSGTTSASAHVGRGGGLAWRNWVMCSWSQALHFYQHMYWYDQWNQYHTVYAMQI